MNVDFRLPELGENINSGDVVNVLVHEGDVIAGNDGVFELETDKAIVEIPCPHAGRVVKIHVAKGDTIEVGQLLLTIDTAVEDASSPASAASSTPEAETLAAAVEAQGPEESALPVAVEPSDIPAGPESRRLARELNVDLSTIRGTGKGGRITVEDVHAAGSRATDESDKDAYGAVRREQMSKIRQTIAARMTESAAAIPHVTTFDDADVTALEELRKSIPPARTGPDGKLTALPFVLKAAALALQHNPYLNASIDEARGSIVMKQYIHIGVAVDTPRGLVVPVLRNVDQINVLQIAKEVATLAARARSAEFSVNELRGGTFTISNQGAVGGEYSTPIINQPEVAILLLGRSRWMLKRREGQIEDRLMMPLSLSFDHRVVDGAAACRFLNEIIGYLQSPGQLLLPE